jgi:hypothetical protein
MALTLEADVKVKERTRYDMAKPAIAENCRALWKHLQALGNPDLQFVPIAGLETADVVLANVAAKLYALYLKKPAASTVDSWAKISNSATASAAGADLSLPFVGTGGGGREQCLIWGDGLPFATGITIGAHTSIAGSSKTLVADAVIGWAIVGG